jgi:hypothetical protein
LLNNLAIMKTLKSALLGAKNLEDSHAEIMLQQLKDIIRQHRAVIITRLLGDLPTYLDYKFQLAKPTKTQLDYVKDELLALKNSGVELTHYEAVLNQLETKNVVHLTNEPFYVEIDALVNNHLKEQEIKKFKLQPAQV